ncbi:MAG: FAD-binding protein, partial [Sutterellaceae bacterium]|nr:FAD-binding protein [Sutterellaceae bacterium]
TQTPENYAYHIIDAHWEGAAKAAKKFIGMKTKVWMADTIEELAKKMGADPKVLKATVDGYNKAFAEKKLDQMTPPCSLTESQPLNKAPFYAFPFQGGITATFGGPKIDARARVTDTEGYPILGLYAAGNAAGGLFFGNYIGGTQLGGATVFGRIAAREMAAHHKKA